MAEEEVVREWKRQFPLLQDVIEGHGLCLFEQSPKPDLTVVEAAAGWPDEAQDGFPARLTVRVAKDGTVRVDMLMGDGGSSRIHEAQLEEFTFDWWLYLVLKFVESTAGD